MTDLPDETWLPVVGWESFYEVSDLGRVRSLDRLACLGRGDRIGVRRGRLLNPTADRRSGYLIVGLWASPRHRTNRVHRLVLEAFVGPCPVGMEALHDNGVPDDNRLVNLSWGSRQANVADVIRHGNHNHASTDVCQRGHKKVEPNLVRSGVEAGYRLCRSCAQAAHTQSVKAGPAQEWGARMQTESDRRYHLLMAGRIGSIFIDVDWCAARYQEGWTGQQIAEEVGCSAATVLRYLRKAGVEIRPVIAPGGGRKPRRPAC